MFKKCIVATDLSPASNAVVSCLGGLKDYGVEDCLLLQCLSFADAASTAYSYHTEPLEELLNIQKTTLEQQGFRVEARTVVGTPKLEINRIAVQENFDLVVIGAQGHSLAEEKMLGGVAYGVINKTSKPVLVVPVEKEIGNGETCKPLYGGGLRDHLLFATDFSAIADHAFAYLEKLAAEGVKKITLVHIQDKKTLEQHSASRLEESNQRDRERLEVLKQALLERATPKIELEILPGTPYQEITHLVRERNVQMVIMGTQGRSFVEEIFLGSVSHNVIRHSVAPVLLIPVPR